MGEWTEGIRKGFLEEVMYEPNSQETRSARPWGQERSRERMVRPEGGLWPHLETGHSCGARQVFLQTPRSGAEPMGHGRATTHNMSRNGTVQRHTGEKVARMLLWHSTVSCCL